MKTHTASIIATAKKNILFAICILVAVIGLSHNTVAHAVDESYDIPTNDEIISADDLGPAIWMSADGITHTSDGLAWGPDGVVYVENDPSLGSAIWMDSEGIALNSDGIAWGAAGVGVFLCLEDSTFCVTHSTKIGTAIWCDERGNVHDLSNTCFIDLTVDEDGTITSNSGGMELLFDCSTVVVTYYLSATNSVLFQVLAADTHQELMAIVVNLPL